MRILHISKYYPPYSGGIEDVAFNIVSICKSFNADQMVICNNDDNLLVEEKYDGVEVVRVPTQAVVAKQPLSFSYFHELRRCIKKFNPDYIHIHLPNPLVSFLLLLCKVDSAKIIVHWHSDIVEQKLIYPFYRRIENRLLCKAEKILVTSEEYARKSAPLTGFDSKLQILPNIVNEDKLKITDLVIDEINRLSDIYKKPIILFVGRHVKYKGLEFLLESEKYISTDAVILVTGSGPLTEELKRCTESDRIQFLGRVSDVELTALMHLAKVFAFPSITKNEAFGVALAEALYCNTPAVTFTIDGSGVNWVNKNGISGIEVPNGDVHAFAQAIDQILSNEGLYDKLSQGAGFWCRQNFTRDQIYKIVINTYSAVHD